MREFQVLKRSVFVLFCSISLWVLPAITQDESSTTGQQKVVANELAPPAANSDESAAQTLQKATQNPVASLISVPIQNSSNFNVGPYNRTQDIINIQPVIPVKLNDNWNLITRIIQPI